MKYLEFISYLINPQKLEGLYEKIGINKESEALLIYMKGALNVASDISLFEIEETDDDLIFEKQGVIYYQLFEIEHAIDLIERDLQLKDRGYSELQIAQRLLDYRVNDA